MGYVPPPRPSSRALPVSPLACAYCEALILPETTDSRGRCKGCGATERVVPAGPSSLDRDFTVEPGTWVRLEPGATVPPAPVPPRRIRR